MDRAIRFSGFIIFCVGLACAGCAAASVDGQDTDRAAERDWMVTTQIIDRGITHPSVVGAMRRVPRHRFVPAVYQRLAYDDTPLPIGYDQTISQPFIVGYMTQVLDPSGTDRVLEIGTGSGYQAAVLAEIVGELYSIEIVPELAERARGTLDELGYRNVTVRHGNGYAGWPDAAPFDKIIVTAAPEEMPAALVEQLAVGGLLVAPVGGSFGQTMTIVRKTADGVTTQQTIAVTFVPMVGKPSGTGS
jgi:protein-L-isoaspartate(D-aspartate) O-methyltransferase